MAGYYKNKMSNNAITAYCDGKKPLSKWTKSEILTGIAEILENEEIEKTLAFEKLTKKELQEHFLRRAEWHHTGAFYNVTQFYELCDKNILNFSFSDFEEIVKRRTEMPKAGKAQKLEKTEQKKDVAEVYKKLEVIFESKITNLNTFNGIIRRFTNGKMDLEVEYKKAIAKVYDDYLPKIKQWENLPADHWRQADVLLFKNDLEQFAQRFSCSGNLPRANSAEFEKIKNAL